MSAAHSPDLSFSSYYDTNMAVFRYVPMATEAMPKAVVLRR